MTERGEPKNLVVDVEDKKTAEKMTERGEPKNLVVDVEDKKTADVEAVKGPIKRIITQMMPLVGPAKYCEEAALMYQILAEELSKIKITTLTKEEIIQLLEEKD